MGPGPLSLAVIGLVALTTAATTAAASARDASGPRHRALTVHRHRAPTPEPREIASPLDLPVGDGVFVRTPFDLVATADRPVLVRIPHYQGPDGSYEEPADVVRAINGTPCGQACTSRALARWGYVPGE